MRQALVDAEFSSVRTLAEIFGDDRDGQMTDDDIWIDRCAQEGWVVLTKDRESLLTVHREQIERLGVMTFILPKAGLNGREQVERIIRNRYRIAQRAAKRNGHCLWLVRPDTLERA